MYTLLIHIYALCVELLSPFHKKARMMRMGQWKTNGILREKIDRNATYVWFHAASLGEFEQGRPMMEKIKKEYPHYKILLTFFSPSGYEVRKNYSGVDVVCYLPFDTPYKVRKFINLANPAVAIFIKYEFWANYLTELHKRDIPVYIISAIFRKDQIFFKWYVRKYRKVLGYYKRIFLQDEPSRQLLAEYGFTNTEVCGDTRFDRVQDVKNLARDIHPVEQFRRIGEEKNQLTLIMGSSWPQDEEVIIPFFNTHPEIRLVIAPHEIHREHLLYIQSLLKRPSIRLSEVNDTIIQNRECIIVDGFGLLSSIYRYADIAYIGGGFGVGIHNTLEAAVYGVPVLFGPKYQKFKEARDLITAGGAFPVANSYAFEEKMNELISNKELIIHAGKIAGDFVESRTGVTDRIVKEIFPLSK